jgi:BirA family biotin operon repressor/biotin-[acetyl-CoA-carboxylase] ligase
MIIFMRLNEQLIRQFLQQEAFLEPLHWHIFDTIDSTNQYLKDLAPNTAIEICCAETQSAGRGRFQRAWFSPTNENIYCSLRWCFSPKFSDLSALSLVIGLAVFTMLKHLELAEDLAIKWPNDLLWRGKKLCGILLETVPIDTQNIAVVIGIGLNVNSNSQDQRATAPDRPWCSLYDMTQKVWDRNWLIAHLLVHIHQYITIFKNQGFSPFLQLWETADYLYGKTITVLVGNQSIQGVAQGISLQGELQVLDANQRRWSIAAGEATLANSDS